MMQVTRLPLGVYQTNCYIIYEESSKTCCVLDPGGEAKKVLEFMQVRDLTLDAILLTHGHFDHVGAVKELHEATGCKVYLCAEDLSMPAKWTAGDLFYTDTYTEGDVLELSGLTIRILHTPGHTPGGITLMVENAMFTGDTLFRGSCGRVDLAGGDGSTILASLKRLAEIPGDYEIYPGHMETSTMAIERMYNPYLFAALNGVTEF